MSAVSKEVDVVIAGAGPAGAACAIALRACSRSVHMVDLSQRVRTRRPATGETLFPGAVPLLERLGVWSAFLSTEPAECQVHGSAWGTSVAEEVSTLTNPYGCGWFLERASFDRVLVDKALRDGATLTSGERLSGLGRHGSGARARWHVRAGDVALQARFLVDATGRSAAVARTLGVRRAPCDALVAVTLEAEGVVHAPASTFVETCPYGWWYVCAGPRDRPVIVLMTDADLLRDLEVSDAKALVTLFETTQAARQFELTRPASKPHVCCAATGVAWPAVGDGYALAGDAAVSFDPLSSRGITGALLSGTHVGQAIHAELSGRQEELQCYAATIARVHADHRRVQAAYYRMERRYRDHPFWARRLSAA